MSEVVTTGQLMHEGKVVSESTSQTQVRGSNSSEYEIYVANAEDLGWPVKTYEEWLNS